MLYNNFNSFKFDTYCMALHTVYSEECPMCIYEKYAFCYRLVKYSVDANYIQLIDIIVHVSFIIVDFLTMKKKH